MTWRNQDALVFLNSTIDSSQLPGRSVQPPIGGEYAQTCVHMILFCKSSIAAALKT